MAQMSTRSNKHIKKYNQLVEVYDPAGLDAVTEVTSEKSAMLEARHAEVEVLRERADALTVDDFFSEDEQSQMQQSETMPDPEDAAASQRSDLVERLAEIERALSAALAETSALDASGQDGGLGADGG